MENRSDERAKIDMKTRAFGHSERVCVCSPPCAFLIALYLLLVNFTAAPLFKLRECESIEQPGCESLRRPRRALIFSSQVRGKQEDVGDRCHVLVSKSKGSFIRRRRLTQGGSLTEKMETYQFLHFQLTTIQCSYKARVFWLFFL